MYSHPVARQTCRTLHERFIPMSDWKQTIVRENENIVLLTVLVDTPRTFIYRIT